MTLKELKEKYRSQNLDEFELKDEGDTVWLWGYGTYERGSVLAGSFKESRLDAFDSVEEATKAYPFLPPPESDGGLGPMTPEMSDTPPAGFSYYDAGEHWSEDDY